MTQGTEANSTRSKALFVLRNKNEKRSIPSAVGFRTTRVNQQKSGSCDSFGEEHFKHKSPYVAGWWWFPDVLHCQDVEADRLLGCSSYFLCRDIGLSRVHNGRSLISAVYWQRSLTQQGSPLAAQLNTAHDWTTLKGSPLAAELNTAHDLTTLKGGPLAAELNTAHGSTINDLGGRARRNFSTRNFFFPGTASEK